MSTHFGLQFGYFKGQGSCKYDEWKIDKNKLLWKMGEV